MSVVVVRVVVGLVVGFVRFGGSFVVVAVVVLSFNVVSLCFVAVVGGVSARSIVFAVESIVAVSFLFVCVVNFCSS